MELIYTKRSLRERTGSGEQKTNSAWKQNLQPNHCVWYNGFYIIYSNKIRFQVNTIVEILQSYL